MSHWLTRWKFEGDPRKWIGKTIVACEVLEMEYRSVGDTCILFQFQDDSRGWCVGRPSNGVIVGPSSKSMEKSRIITPEEIGQVAAARHREKMEYEERQRADKRRQLENLRKELGEI